MRTFPLAPLVAAVNARYGAPVDVVRLARLLGVDRWRVYDARAFGLSVDLADKWAIAIGLHPLEVWPDFHADIDPERVPEVPVHLFEPECAS